MVMVVVSGCTAAGCIASLLFGSPATRGSRAHRRGAFVLNSEAQLPSSEALVDHFVLEVYFFRAGMDNSFEVVNYLGRSERGLCFFKAFLKFLALLDPTFFRILRPVQQQGWLRLFLFVLKRGHSWQQMGLRRCDQHPRA